MAKNDYFFDKNFKTARLLNKGKVKCKKCGLFLCVCQSQLTEFDKDLLNIKSGFCKYCKHPRVLNKNGFCCKGHEEHYKNGVENNMDIIKWVKTGHLDIFNEWLEIPIDKNTATLNVHSDLEEHLRKNHIEVYREWVLLK